MKLLVNNMEYNFIIKRLRRLEEAYKQSCDKNVRIAVRDQTLVDISDAIYGFYEQFGEKISLCKMGSLKEILDLIDEITGELDVQNMQELSLSSAKKMLKLRERQLVSFVNEYNDVNAEKNLTYYGKQIDQKYVMISESSGELISTIADIPKETKNSETLCCFCKQFRKGNDIMFITSTAKKSNGEYNTIGQYCCSDYEKCNADIENNEGLVKFISFAQSKKRRK